MADPHHVVEAIRALLQPGQVSDEGTLRGLAEGYTAACAEINDRLLTCARLINQGLKTEALHQAGLAPGLLDVVAALDFPERGAWDGLTAARGLAAAPALNLDAAEAVNQAYAAPDTLRNLLRRHRLLALSHAPLRKRLGVLRSIAAQDIESPFWHDDVAAYERERLLQIQTEAALAVKRGDVEALRYLDQELGDPAWTTPPTAVVVKRVGADLAAAVREHSRRHLAEAAGALAHAHGALDLEAARRFRNVWAAHEPDARLADDDPLRSRARSALNWVEHEDQRESDERARADAVEALAAALDRGEPEPDVLCDLRDVLLDFGQSVPEHLAGQLDASLTVLTRRRRRRRATLGAVLSTVVLLVAAGFYKVVSDRAFARDADTAAAALVRLVDQGQLEAGRLYLDRLRLRIARSDAVVAAAARLRSKVKKDQQRVARLRQLLNDLGCRTADRPAPPELAEVRSLTRLEAERVAADEAARNYLVRYEAFRGKVGRELERRLAEVKTEVERLESAPLAPAADRDAERLQGLLTAMSGDRSSPTPDAPLQSAQALLARVKAEQGRRRRLEQQSRLEHQLTSAAAFPSLDPSPFGVALTDYAEALAGTPRANDVRRVLEERPLWAGVVAWSRARAGWPARLPLLVDSPTAAARYKQCQLILANSPSFPDAPSVGRYARFLEAVARRGGFLPRDGGKSTSVRADLEAIWGEDLATRLKFVQDADGRNYYFIDEPEDRSTARTYLCFVDLDRAHARSVRIPKAKIAMEGEAPQVALAAKVNRGLLKNPDWDWAVLSLLRDLLRPETAANAAFDPVYRLSLLRSTAGLGAEGSQPLAAALEPLTEALAKAAIDTSVFWMNPDDKPAGGERLRAAEVLRGLPSLAGAEAVAERFRTDLARALATDKASVGWLSREGASWRLRSDRPVPEGTTLWVVCPEEGGAGAWRRLGVARAGAVDTAGTDPKALVEARPVFAVNSTHVDSQPPTTRE